MGESSGENNQWNHAIQDNTTPSSKMEPEFSTNYPRDG